MAEVVVGVDESDGAAEAARWAAREAELRGWSLTAVMAWGFLDQHQTAPGAAFDPQYGEDDAAAALDAILGRALGDAKAAEVRRRVVCDLPARALLEAAAGSELLVVGARGLGGFKALLLGSVSQHCLQHAETPIAVIRHADGAAEPHGRVVAAVDGSETSALALAWAVDEARLRGASLRVVNAWQRPYVGGYPYTTETFEPGVFEHASRRVLTEALESCDTDGITVETVSAEGTPARVVLDAAGDADLVVMGSRGLGAFAGMLLGSAAHQVVLHAPCPVVVVPPSPRG